MSGIREEFEAAIFAEVNEQRAAEGDFALQHGEGLFARDDDGSYSIRWVKSAWWAWQASRAVLKVELPDRKQFVEYYEGLEGGELNWRKYLTAVTEALQQAGIEVVK